MSKIAIYTVLTGDKEPLGNPITRVENRNTDLDIDFICFTDNPTLRSDVWNCRVFDTHALPPEKSSRRPKALPHEYLESYEFSLYIDNICELKRLPSSEDLRIDGASRYLYKLFKHSSRQFISEEALAIASLGYDTAENLIKQLYSYELTTSLSEITPLSTCTLLLRQHNDMNIKEHGIRWWEHILNFSKRDQMSFDFCRIATGLKVNYIPGNKFQNELIFPHSNQASNRSLANIDSLKAQIINGGKDTKTSHHAALLNDSVRSAAEIPPQDFEVLAYLAGSNLGNYHSNAKNLSTVIQKLRETPNLRGKRLIGITIGEVESNCQENFNRSIFALQAFFNCNEVTSLAARSLRQLESAIHENCFNPTGVLLFIYKTESLGVDSVTSILERSRLTFLNLLPETDEQSVELFSIAAPKDTPSLGVELGNEASRKSPTKRVPSNIAYCDGGLANRLYTVIFALVLRKKYGHDWQISWPRTSVCDADFNRLFSGPLKFDCRNIKYYKDSEDEYIQAVHHNFGNFSTKNLVLNSSLKSYEDYESLLSKGPLFYMHNSLPGFVTVDDIHGVLGDLEVNIELRSKAELFVKTNKISKHIYGLHLRKTDFGEKVKDSELFEIVRNNPNKFFVCSDSESALLEFGKLPNCILSPTRKFPNKLVDNMPWGAVCVNTRGVTVYNIDRSEESVEDAVIDLLILSKTSIVDTSNSSFLLLAKILAATSPI